MKYTGLVVRVGLSIWMFVAASACGPAAWEGQESLSFDIHDPHLKADGILRKLVVVPADMDPVPKSDGDFGTAQCGLSQNFTGLAVETRLHCPLATAKESLPFVGAFALADENKPDHWASVLMLYRQPGQKWKLFGADDRPDRYLGFLVDPEMGDVGYLQLVDGQDGPEVVLEETKLPPRHQFMFATLAHGPVEGGLEKADDGYLSLGTDGMGESTYTVSTQGSSMSLDGTSDSEALRIAENARKAAEAARAYSGTSYGGGGGDYVQLYYHPYGHGVMTTDSHMRVYKQVFWGFKGWVDIFKY